MHTEISFALTGNQTMIRRLFGPRRIHSTVHTSTVLAVSEPSTDSPLCRKAALSVGHCSYDGCGKAVGYHKDDMRLPLSPVQTSHLRHAQVSQLGLRTNGTRIRFLYPLHIHRDIE